MDSHPRHIIGEVDAREVAVRANIEVAHLGVAVSSLKRGEDVLRDPIDVRAVHRPESLHLRHEVRELKRDLIVDFEGVHV